MAARIKRALHLSLKVNAITLKVPYEEQFNGPNRALVITAPKTV